LITVEQLLHHDLSFTVDKPTRRILIDVLLCSKIYWYEWLEWFENGENYENSWQDKLRNGESLYL